MKFCPICNEVYENVNAKFCANPTHQTELEAIIVNSQYEIVSRLGKGGMGVVFHAKDRHLAGRDCAVKVISIEGVSHHQEQILTERFLHEIYTLSRIKHENIVVIYDKGLTYSKCGIAREKTHFYVMEYLKGQTLEELLKTEKSLPLGRVMFLLRQFVNGLSAIHSENVLHRDFKPANVLITQENNREKVKIVDFGIAKAYDDKKIDLTKTNVKIGTPNYMSPEQDAADKNLDVRSDLYSLAVVIYKMLTGKLPFNFYREFLLKKPISPSQANPSANIPVEIDEVILKALSVDPDSRHNDLQEFFDEFFFAAQKADLRDLTLPLSHHEVGTNHYRAGYYSNALEEFNLALKVSADSFYKRGLVSFEQGDYAKATSDFAQAIDLEPREEYYYFNSLTFYELNDYTRARNNITEAIKINSNYSYYYYFRGKTYFHQKDYSLAIADFAQALRLNQEEVNCYYYLGLAYYFSSNYDLAIKSFNEAINVNPQDFVSLYKRGLVYLRKGDVEQAIRDFQASLKLKNDSEVRQLLNRLIK